MKEKRKMKYEIQCGVIDEVIEAKNHEVAFKKLIKKYQPKFLAILMRFRELDRFNRPLRIIDPKTDRRTDSGKWKYQNPLAILNIKREKTKKYPSTNDLYKKDNGKSYNKFETEMMDKMRKIRKGSPVETTKYALGNRIVREMKRGILKGFGRQGNYIRVQPKGLKSVHSYWVGFWQPIRK